MSETKLKSLLRERGMTLSGLARAVEVDKATVTRWSNGRVPPERVRDVEKVTGIPPHDLRPDLWDAPQSVEAAE
jgi:DNA-binding transcriptional regulator YdaS (Cro superfamily)